MSTYPPDQLMHLWKTDQIDSQMAIGHVLQNLAILTELVNKLSAAQVRVKLDVDNLTQQVKALAAKI
ncbi:MAG: hypothetical protein U0350_25030 [Caldilineaceae bacterium]